MESRQNDSPHAAGRRAQGQAELVGVELDKLRAVIESVVCAHALELVLVEWAGGVLRVFIERPSERERPLAGVTLEDCVSVSRDLSTALDVADIIAHSYTLEVSSPGLNRPLTRALDFQRQVGKLAKCKLIQPASDGQLALRGIIVSAGEDAIKMTVDGKQFDVPLSNIREAKLVFGLGGDKPGTRKAPHRGRKTKQGRQRK